jgi:hypothetical protein
MIFKNVCPIFFVTFLLNGGLYQRYFVSDFGFEWLYDLVGACTLIGVYNHYSEVLAGIVARLVEMIPHRMIFQLGVC